MYEVSIQNVMTHDVVTAKVNDVASKVVQVFQEHTFHHLPVVDDDNSLVGIISRSDFERMKYGAGLFRNPKVEEYNKALFESMRVKKIMTKDVTYLQLGDDIAFAYKIFKEKSFRALPVIDRGRLVGIVTPLDILDYYFQNVNI